MSLCAGEFRAQKRRDKLAGQRRPYDPGAKRNDVHRVVLDALVRRKSIMAKSTANAHELVRSNRRADAASADEHSASGAALCHGARDARREVRIVVARLELECATV